MEDIICEIKFNRLRLSEDGNSVIIAGEVMLREVTAKLSILQMAKVFGTDREIARDAESDFDMGRFEKRCDETRKFVNNFPLISVWNNKVDFAGISVGNPIIKKEDRNTVGIYAEQMAGWKNAGLRIDFPADIYHDKLAGKKFRIFMSPFSVEFRK